MTTAQKQAAAFWVALIVGGLVVDYYLNEQHAGLTLSERTREAKDSVPAGDRWFTLIWAGFSLWFWNHIMKRVDG